MRKDILRKPKLIVLKLGSSSITKPIGGLNKSSLNKITRDVISLYESGTKVVIVSSGAIHSARGIVDIKTDDIASLQALSAIGQPLLMEAFRAKFKKHQINCAQILLTHEDFKNKKRYLNAKNTIHFLLSNGIIPILNENDTVSFDEITVGDNDHLAAMTAQMLSAELLVMLTNAQGLFTGDPSEAKSRLVKKVQYDDELNELKTVSKSGAGRGGMKSKITAIKKVTPLGIPVILSTYKESAPVINAINKEIGTFFYAKKLLDNKKAWLLTTVKTDSSIEVDEGAFKAISKHASLLPVGMNKTQGNFSRGDCISIKFKNKTFAVGVAEYSSSEVKRLIEDKSGNIEAVLGYKSSKVIIHRNHMVLKGNK